ncbi:MAG: hypothetical protein ACREMY_30365, partial [bacterium]
MAYQRNHGYDRERIGPEFASRRRAQEGPRALAASRHAIVASTPCNNAEGSYLTLPTETRGGACSRTYSGGLTGKHGTPQRRIRRLCTSARRHPA